MIPRAWYNTRIAGFPQNRWEKEQVVFSEEGPRVPKMHLALEQPHTCTGATLGLLGCSRARDIFVTPGLPPKRLLAPSPIDLGGIQQFGHCTKPVGWQRYIVPLSCHPLRSAV